MPSGPQICALRASERPTSGNDSIGWPTPTATDGRRGSETEQAPNTTLNIAAAQVLAGWPTCTGRDSKGGYQGGRMRTGKHAKSGPTLDLTAQLAGWTTPQAHDSKGRSHTQKEKHGTAHGCACLARQAEVAGWTTPTSTAGGANSQRENRQSTGGPDLKEMAGWTTPQANEPESPPRPSREATGRTTDYLSRQVHGATSTSSHAATEKRGALNPALPRWLMGYPVVWDSCGATAMRSYRKSRPSSS